jgi:hypothetical protein
LVLDQAKRKELFSDRKMEVTKAEQISAGPARASITTREQATAATPLTPAEVPSQQAVATVAQKEPEPMADTTPTPKEVSQESKAKIGLDVEEVPQKENTPIVQPPRQESPTIISWSAGRSGKRTKGKGFFLWRLLNKLLNR